MAYVYLLHFESNFHHAKHYIGFAQSSVEKRVQQHQDGKGAALTKAVVTAGIKLIHARTWVGDRSLERLLKNQKNAPRLCPICKEILNQITDQHK